MELTPPARLSGDVIRKLKSRGHQAYLVGGCVRDRLLGVPPGDYDVATDARPDQVLQLWPDANQVGAHFGVVLVRNKEAEVEVATYRSDGVYTDSRHPHTVHYETDPRQDVLRRDFTVNALLEDPETGEILDFVDGRKDLSEGLIRAIGDPEKRFREDHLRLLRAVRFAARLRFQLEETTKAAIRRLHHLVHTVAPERIRDELVRILTEGQPRRGFELLAETGLLQTILPEVAAMQGVAQPPEYHPEGDVWTHTMLMLDGLPSGISATLALGVLLHDVGKPPTFRIADRIRFDGHVEAGVAIANEILLRLRFSTAEREQVAALVANHMKFKDLQNMRESTLKRFLRLPEFPEHLELHRLDCSNSNGILTNYAFASDLYKNLGAEQISPPRLLTGKDLLVAGYQPGPQLGRLLHQVEDAQLEGRVRTREEALALARQLSPPTSEPAST